MPPLLVRPAIARAVPQIALLAALFAAPAAPAAAQLACDDPAVRSLTAAPSLDGFRLLFQQTGVSFYARAPAGNPPTPAEIVIRNGNRYPVEVSFTLELEGGQAGPRAVSLGRHCAEIPALRYAATSDSIPGAGGAVRVRNLTIADLSPLPSAAAAPAAGATPAAVPPAQGTPAADTGAGDAAGAAGARRDSAPAAPAASAPAASAPRDSAPSAAERQRRRVEPGAWARDGATAVLSFASVALMLVAGVGLILPIAGAIAVLAVAALSSLQRRRAPGEGG